VFHQPTQTGEILTKDEKNAAYIMKFNSRNDVVTPTLEIAGDENDVRYYLLVIYFLLLLTFFCTYTFLAGLYGNICVDFLTPSFVIYISKHQYHHRDIRRNSLTSSTHTAEIKQLSTPCSKSMSIKDSKRKTLSSLSNERDHLLDSESPNSKVSLCTALYAIHS
jgi:hypothetical protein